MRALEILHSEGADSVVIGDSETHDDIAEVFHNERHTVNQTVEQALETAQLFAAAPALLEACRALDAFWCEGFEPPHDDPDQQEPRLLTRETLAVWRQIRAAIAKAKGGES